MAVYPRHTLTLLALLGATSATALAGQVCPQGEISAITVTPHSIFDTDASTDRGALGMFYNVANGLHADTNENFLRGELLLGVGDCYDPFLADESERLIRQLNFIDRAEVSGVPQPDESVHVIVETWDRWTLQLNVRARFEEGFEFNGVDVAERNLLGRGMTVGAFYRKNRERLAIGGNLATTRLLGTRWDSRLQAARTRAGNTFQQGFFYPFVGEVGRYAAVQSFVREDDLFSYNLPAGGTYTHVVQPYRQRSSEITAAGRIGRPGRLTILGGGLSIEKWEYSKPLGGGGGCHEPGLRQRGAGAYRDFRPLGPAAPRLLEHAREPGPGAKEPLFPTARPPGCSPGSSRCFGRCGSGARSRPKHPGSSIEHRAG